MVAPRLGIALLSGTSGEVAPHLEAVLAAATRCEEAGIELLVLDGRPRPGGAGSWRRLDPFAALAAVAAETRILRLAALVGADERAPSLQAKATSTLDVLSHGRAVLVLAGPSPPGVPDEDLALLGECVEVVQAMLADPAPTIVGRHVAVHGAWNEPRAAGAPPAVGALLPGGQDARIVASWPSAPAFVLAEVDTAAPSAPPRAQAVPEGPATVVLAHVDADAPAVVSPGRGAPAGLVVALDDPVDVTSELLGTLVRAADRAGPPGG